MTITERLKFLETFLNDCHTSARDGKPISAEYATDAMVAFQHVAGALREGSDGVIVADYGDDDDGAVWATTEGEVWGC